MKSVDSLFFKLISCFRKLDYSIRFDAWAQTYCCAMIRKHPNFANQIIAVNKPFLLSGQARSAEISTSKELPPAFNIYLRTRADDNERYVSIEVYTRAGSIGISGASDKLGVYFPGSKKIKTILIFKDYSVTQGFRRNVFYPTTISDLKFLPDKVKDIVFSCFSDSRSYADFISESFYPSIKLESLGNYHNKREYFEKMFKLSLPKSVNKCSFRKLYSVCCAAAYVKPGQINLLLGLPEDVFSYIKFRETKIKRKEAAVSCINDYLLSRFNFDPAERDRIILFDYTNMSIRLKEPIDLKISKKALFREHDALAVRIIKVKMPKIAIPETPLKYLKLPKEFNLLKSSKALREEGEKNHNCVATYADKINKGRCIIYAADINNEHVTIEICCTKSVKKRDGYRFHVNQCLSRFNRHPSEKTSNYVNKQVEAAASDAIAKFLKKHQK